MFYFKLSLFDLKSDFLFRYKVFLCDVNNFWILPGPEFWTNGVDFVWLSGPLLSAEKQIEV